MTEAEIQLGIWVSAQYLKLKELLTHNSQPLTLLWLPLWIVNGEQRYLLPASYSDGITYCNCYFSGLIRSTGLGSKITQ
ncbi:unnamed protein product, partial [Aureobasidium pullulans]